MAPKKAQKMSLGSFLQDENYGSWADEMEDMPLPSSDARPAYGSERRGFSSMGMGGSGFPERRADGYSVREELPLPSGPPYTAHLANLSFDATQADVSDFFAACQVTNVRIVEDKMDRKPKGFGYVEFASLDGLKAALDLSGSNLAGRQVRISVAEPPKDRQDGMNRDFSDWSRKGPLPDLPGQRRVSDRAGGFGGGRNFDNMSDAGSERGQRRAFGGPEGDGKVRDFSNWERKGPLSPSTTAPTSLREGGRQGSRRGPLAEDDGAFRKNSPSWGEGRGEGRSQDGSRPPRREYVERPPPVAREPTASEMDNQWRTKMRPDAPKVPTPEASEPSSPAPPAAPAGRPRLNLQKRTVSEAVDPASSPAQAGDSKASPFGAARPVDTAAKEKEVEEKRQNAVKERKEAEEKAKADKAEEKRLVREKADGEREKAKESSTKDARESTDVKSPVEAKEGEGDEDAKPAPKFDILRRADSNTNDMIPEEDDGEEEVVQPTDDKAVKPKEIVRTPTAGKSNGSWRGKPAKQDAPAESTTAELEEDGWSTVSKPKKQSSGRRYGGPARAAAS